MGGTTITSDRLAENHVRPELIRSGSFAPGIKAGPLVYVSGAAAKDLTKDMAGQAEEVFEYIGLVLSEVGYSLSDIIKVQAFVTDKELYREYNDVRTRFFPNNPPASTTVVTDLLFEGMLVEVEAIAYKD